MSLPETLTIVRHGLSEANLFIAGKSPSGKPLTRVPEEFGSRHDSLMRLSEEGEWQASIAGDWIRKEQPEGFDRYYVSPHIRTRETAAHLALNGDWRIDDRWREREWGLLASLTHKEQKEQWGAVMDLKEQNEWYWQPPSGESLAGGVLSRFNQVLDILHRRSPDENVIAVSHGELIRVAQYAIEQMTPEQWLEMDANKKYKVQNCMILQYSRRNPDTNEINRSDFTHRRAICPWDDSLSWDNGEWVSIKENHFTDDELLESVSKYPRLLKYETP